VSELGDSPVEFNLQLGALLSDMKDAVRRILHGSSLPRGVERVANMRKASVKA
jgi:hypothetical protein